LARCKWLRRIGWWTLYALAFGVIEATVVLYIRKLVGIEQGSGYESYLGGSLAGYGTGSLSETLRRTEILRVETLREAATILLLLGAACGAGSKPRERITLFCYTFAVWDLSYYLYLAAVTGFPRCLTATDVYFLIPAAWVGPVWFPVIIVMPAMIGISLWAARGGKPNCFLLRLGL